MRILRGDQIDLLDLVGAAGKVRRHYFSNTVSIHVLDNVRSGACPEDCGYCGQSRDSDAPIHPYRMKSEEEIIAAAESARQRGAFRFCMSISGRGPSQRDLDHMCRAIERISGSGLRTCLSAGLLDEAAARQLKAAGLDRFNHNLNTSRRRYPQICTTHSYDDRLTTLQAARAAGLSVCCGIIIGMGEDHEDLVDVANELRRLGAESIPVNFLLPIEGNRIATPRCAGQPLSPAFALRVLCMMRLMNPRAEIRMAAGREYHLRSLQTLALWPANSLFMEGYLLTKGEQADRTVKMIHEAGFVPRLEEGDWPQALRDMVDQADSSPPIPDDHLLSLKVNVRHPSLPSGS
jgi:biotin synthase